MHRFWFDAHKVTSILKMKNNKSLQVTKARYTNEDSIEFLLTLNKVLK
jgi:hypothetical protein